MKRELKNKRQVVLIHGGTTFSSYESYIKYLTGGEVTAENFKKRKSWKDHFEEDLGENFEVFQPRMPNGTYAHYGEWKIWFEKLFLFLQNEPIFIGHSLGGIFLARYFSENLFPKKIKAVILIAPPFDDVSNEEELSDFSLPMNIEKFGEQVKDVYLIQSKDDPVVPFGEMEKYKKFLPEAKEIVFEDRGHFNLEFFPELIELIKKISKD